MKSLSRYSLLLGVVVCVMVLSACTTATQETSVDSPKANIGNRIVDIARSGEGGETEEAMESSEGQVRYEETVSYTNPGGAVEVKFVLTVYICVITDAEAEVLATNSTSINRQLAFKSSFKDAVVGKPIAGLKIDRVGGSSLTTKAFNDWVAAL